LKGRLHRVEGENINLRIEQDMMKKDVAELNKEKSSLKVINRSMLKWKSFYRIILTVSESRIILYC
jgi:hypothetical protein